MRSKLARVGVILVLAMVAALLRVTDANPAVAQTQRIGAWLAASQPGLDGSAPEWQSIVPVFLPMTAQQVTPPMGGGTTQRVAVRAMHWEDQLYVMLEWSDSTANHLSDRYESFTDAAAIQFPAEAGSEVPSICMGQADQAVNIWQWRSDQQHDPPGLPEDGYVDLYPETDDLHYTARAAGNPLSQSGRSAVHNLVAGGFGTLTAADSGVLQGYGVHSDGRWMVVFTRPFESAGDLQPTFGDDGPIDVAFAVWDGDKLERDGIKSVSSFTRLTITPEDPPRRAVAATDNWPAYTPPNSIVALGTGFGILLLVLVAVLWVYMSRGLKESRADES